jgi:uncharacterized protein YaaW (UPF0174 family)
MEETATFNLELNVEQCVSEIRRLETLLYRSLALAKRLGLPENINQAISQIQRLTMVIRMLHTAIIALQAASGPIGWALAGVGIASAGLTIIDMSYEASN